MTEYERGYTDGYKDGLHKFIPEVASIPIPQIATERQARIEALEQAREKIAKLDLAHFLYLDRFISLERFQKTILNTIDAMISAERERLADAGETIDPYAMHICDTCDSESGMECTRRNCHLNNAWHPRHTEHAKPEPGDVVAWPNPPHGHVMIGLYGRDWTSDIGLVVLMRAAEVRARIEARP